MLSGLALVFAVNNVLIKFGNQGLQPVFFAGMRSALALVAVGLWMAARGISFRTDLWREGLVVGLLFSAEFLLLFSALDNTSVVRASSLFYAMPIWMALIAHFLFPGERLTAWRLLGLALGFAGVVVTLAGRAGGLGEGSLGGDLAALGAGLAWATIPAVTRSTRLGASAAETQIFWQLAVSALLLPALAPLFGTPLVRDFDGLQLSLLLVQAIGVVAMGFVLWFWLLGRYPASTVASFSFLTPVLSALLGWLVLGEEVSPTTPLALALLIAGLVLINRRKKG